MLEQILSDIQKADNEWNVVLLRYFNPIGAHKSGTIGDNTLIGMGAIVLNGAKIGKNCIIGAGALIPQGMEIPDGSMAFGSPAKIRRPVTEEEVASNRAAAAFYCTEAAEYAE